MQDGAAIPTLQTRRLAMSLTALGGAIAGAILSTTFSYSGLVSPPIFYALFGLGGVIYGALACVGIRLQLPTFGWAKIARHAGLVGVGFLGGCLLAFSSSAFIFWAAFILPPLIGALLGHLARRWIAEAGNIPLVTGKPGWALGALVY